MDKWTKDWSIDRVRERVSEWTNERTNDGESERVSVWVNQWVRIFLRFFISQTNSPFFRFRHVIQKEVIQTKSSLSSPQDGDSCTTHLRQRIDTTAYCKPTSCCCCCSHGDGSTLTYSRPRHKPKNKALTVDIVSRILFPLLFMVFNVLYWPLYVWDIKSLL